MGERDSYPPGTFCWADLGTTDAAAAQEFYTGLFGWDAEPLPAGEGGVYVMFRIRGRDVSALYEMGESERSQLSAHWSSYVSVDDVEAMAEKATGLDASVVAEPFDVMDSGRMAVLRDPTGAHVHLWQPGRHAGAGRVNEPGCIVWNELATPDSERAGTFYEELLGWEPESDATGYSTIRKGDQLIGGIRPLRDQEPPNWLIYFGVEDVEKGVEHVRANGGEVLAGPAEVTVGKIAVVRDPQGAMFAIYEGDVDP
jgi:predicted enzyme related to lactoylglutathione lyase